MGFNISGIAISKSYENNLNALQDDLNLTLQFQEDIIFEKASANWTEEGVAYVYFSKASTLLFLPMEMCGDAYPVKGANTLSFALSEMSMTFSLNYCEDEEIKRAIMEYDGRKMSEQGTPFDFENTSDDSSEIIWKKLDDVLDISYHAIDLGALAKKYTVVYGRPARLADTSPAKNTSKPALKADEKPWWKFW